MDSFLEEMKTAPEPVAIADLMKRSDNFWGEDDDTPVVTNRFVL